jgi:hypothetical protein
MSRVRGSSEIVTAMVTQSEQQVDVAEAHHKMFSIASQILGNPLLHVATHHDPYVQHAPSLELLHTCDLDIHREE